MNIIDLITQLNIVTVLKHQSERLILLREAKRLNQTDNINQLHYTIDHDEMMLRSFSSIHSKLTA